jgi:hypothetical protein
MFSALPPEADMLGLRRQVPFRALPNSCTAACSIYSHELLKASSLGFLMGLRGAVDIHLGPAFTCCDAWGLACFQDPIKFCQPSGGFLRC